MKKLVVVIVLVTSSARVDACSCFPPASPSVSLESRDAIFRGTVLSVSFGNDDINFRFTFEVTEVWKGPTGVSIDVLSPLEGICGIPFEEGGDYIVYADVEQIDDELHTYCYFRTRPYDAREATDLGEPIWTPATAVLFRRGDANADGEIDLSDAVTVVMHLFLGGVTLSCQKAADADDSGELELTDAIVLLGYLFRGERPPSEPLGVCGRDPTADLTTCESYPPCA